MGAGGRLTWAGRLDLGLALLGVGVEEVWGRVLAALDLALEGVQTLDVLLLERAGGAARRAHVQVGGQLPPLLVLVHLVGDTSGRRRLREQLVRTHNTRGRDDSCASMTGLLFSSQSKSDISKISAQFAVLCPLNGVTH